MVAFEYTGQSGFAMAASVLGVAAVAIFSRGVKASRVAFVFTAVALVVWDALTRANWGTATVAATQRGAMVRPDRDPQCDDDRTRDREMRSVSGPPARRIALYHADDRRALRIDPDPRLDPAAGHVATEIGSHYKNPEITRQRTCRMMIAI
ncbi:copper transporter family protein [Loktanella sp. SALINAS62]|uniref:copper transporter family protein n=1 Tax=Loktanella sp. SALINAS62 TaxID=2706124 RepID=UPI001B8D3592|nr:copper transporter family protein [Loktanella sp. SALINAS62]